MTVYPPEEALRKVEVEKIGLRLDPTDLDNCDEVDGGTSAVLWTTFGTYHSRFQFLDGKDWYRASRLFRDRLVALAKDKDMDAAALARCIDRYASKPDASTAFVPVGAFADSYGGEAVWIVVYVWEIAYHQTQTSDNRTVFVGGALGHIWVRVIRMNDAVQIAQAHCG